MLITCAHLRLRVLCYEYESLKISLLPTRLLKGLTFHFPLQSTHLRTLVSGFHGLHSCTPSLQRFGKVAKTLSKKRRQRGHSNITTRLSLKHSREHDKMKSQVRRAAEAAVSIPVSHDTRCLTRTQLQGCMQCYLDSGPKVLLIFFSLLKFLTDLEMSPL